MNAVADFFRRNFGRPSKGGPVPLQTSAYVRDSQDQKGRLSLSTLTATSFATAASAYSEGNPSTAADIIDSMLQTDPEIKAALKQLKTAIAGIEFVPVPPNDSKRAKMIAERLRLVLEDPDLNIRGLKGWMVEQRVRGGGLTEVVWNDPKEPEREWERFVPVPQQRTRINRITGEMQFSPDPFAYQGTDVSAYDRGKWIVVQPDLHIHDYALRGVWPALVNDWYGRMNVMGWWNQSIERDAMKTLVAKAGSEADAASLDIALRNRGAAGSFLVRDANTSITALEGTIARTGNSPYAEYMGATAKRLFLALLGESQTGIAQGAGKQTAALQGDIARYVIEDICTDIAFCVERDLFEPWVILNYGEGDEENAPAWVPKLDRPVDIVQLNEAISTRPANVKLGVNWYRQQTQWPEPLPKEEPLAAPMPLPGQFPTGGTKPPAAEKEATGDKPNDAETPKDEGAE